MKLAVALVLAALVLAACISPQHAEALRELDGMLAQRVLTPEQHRVLRDALLASGGFDWLTQAVTALVGGVTGVAAVRLQRGPAAPPEEKWQRKLARATRKK